MEILERFFNLIGFLVVLFIIGWIVYKCFGSTGMKIYFGIAILIFPGHIFTIVWIVLLIGLVVTALNYFGSDVFIIAKVVEILHRIFWNFLNQARSELKNIFKSIWNALKSETTSIEENLSQRLQNDRDQGSLKYFPYIGVNLQRPKSYQGGIRAMKISEVEFNASSGSEEFAGTVLTNISGGIAKSLKFAGTGLAHFSGGILGGLKFAGTGLAHFSGGILGGLKFAGAGLTKIPGGISEALKFGLTNISGGIWEALKFVMATIKDYIIPLGIYGYLGLLLVTAVSTVIGVMLTRLVIYGIELGLFCLLLYISNGYVTDFVKKVHKTIGNEGCILLVSVLFMLLIATCAKRMIGFRLFVIAFVILILLVGNGYKAIETTSNKENQQHAKRQ